MANTLTINLQLAVLSVWVGWILEVQILQTFSIDKYQIHTVVPLLKHTL